MKTALPHRRPQNEKEYDKKPHGSNKRKYIIKRKVGSFNQSRPQKPDRHIALTVSQKTPVFVMQHEPYENSYYMTGGEGSSFEFPPQTVLLFFGLRTAFGGKIITNP